MHTAIFYNKIQGWHILMTSIFQYMSKCKLDLKLITADTNKSNKISDMLYQSSTNHVQIRHILVWQQTFTNMHSIGQCSSLTTAFALQTEITLIQQSHGVATKGNYTTPMLMLSTNGASENYYYWINFHKPITNILKINCCQPFLSSVSCTTSDLQWQ